MDVIDAAFPAAWGWASLAFCAALLGYAIRGASWRRLAATEAAHVWYGSILGLAVLWSINGGLASGVSFHLLGVSLFALTSGPRLAFVGTAIVAAIVTAIRGGHWLNYGLAALTMGAVPVAVTGAMLRIAERRLPANFFVYIFVVTFFGAWLALLAGGLAAAFAAVAGAGLPVATVASQYLVVTALLGAGEATMTGMLMTLLVVYRPTWVATFDDRRYLGQR